LSLPDDLKLFLRDIYGVIVRSKFTDKMPATIPVKTLFIHRFLFGPNVESIRGFFKDLFFDVSLTKYSNIPEFKPLFEQFKAAFQRVT
jgi:hypothetical protein